MELDYIVLEGLVAQLMEMGMDKQFVTEIVMILMKIYTLEILKSVILKIMIVMGWLMILLKECVVRLMISQLLGINLRLKKAQQI